MADSQVQNNGRYHLPLSDLQLSSRIQLAHALVEFLATEAGVDLLHIKGYAAQIGLYSTGRTSTDVDVLVRPSHIHILVEALSTKGWKVVTTFQSGSIFRHATTLWHDQWGHMDVHRHFPGVGIDPEEFFNLLWNFRQLKTIAQWPCHVPAPLHHALLITLHGARDPHRGDKDVQHLRKSLPEDDWDKLERLAIDVQAVLTFAAATGTLGQWANHHEHDFWDVISRGGTRTELFRARWRASHNPAKRWELIRNSLLINRDHLRMKLQREPRTADYASEIRARIHDVIQALRRRRSSAGGP